MSFSLINITVSHDNEEEPGEEKGKLLYSSLLHQPSLESWYLGRTVLTENTPFQKICGGSGRSGMRMVFELRF